MSGIYISGIQPPNGFTKMEIGYDASGAMMVAVNGEVFDAIPVPDHGRLIDADALEVLSWTEDPTKNFDDGVMFALDKLDALPTIIPADGGGKA